MKKEHKRKNLPGLNKRINTIFLVMNKKKLNRQDEKEITRKEALKKLGTYAAFTALGTMVLLSPKAAQAGSQAPATPGSRPAW